MANFPDNSRYLHPFYNNWDDGTYGAVNWADAKGAARQRLENWHRMNLEAPEWRGHHDTRLMDPNAALYYAGNSWRSPVHSTTPLPEILQPETQRVGLQVKTDAFDRHNLRLNELMQGYESAEPWRKPEVFMDYSLQKNLTDAARVDLSKQKANLSNAEWLEFRDKQIRLLEESNPEFSKDVNTVRRLGLDYHSRMVANHKKFGKAYKDMGTATNMWFYISEGRIPPGFDNIDDAKAAYEKLRKEAGAVIDGIQGPGGTHEQAINVRESDEFAEAHARTQETLRKAGLNKRGMKLAGRLLAATPYDELKSLVNAARTGGVVDADGNFPSPEEIREETVNTNYDATLRYLARSEKEVEEDNKRQKKEEEAYWANVARIEKENAAKEIADGKEKRVRSTIEISNDKLILKHMDH